MRQTLGVNGGYEDDVGDGEGEDVEALDVRGHEEGDEHAVVAAPDAVPDPRAVVVEVEHAGIAQAAMGAAAAAVHQARSANTHPAAKFTSGCGDVDLGGRRVSRVVGQRPRTREHSWLCKCCAQQSGQHCDEEERLAQRDGDGTITNVN